LKAIEPKLIASSALMPDLKFTAGRRNAVVHKSVIEPAFRR
jgi:hypothetical protein